MRPEDWFQSLKFLENFHVTASWVITIPYDVFADQKPSENKRRGKKQKHPRARAQKHAHTKTERAREVRPLPTRDRSATFRPWRGAGGVSCVGGAAELFNYVN